MDRLETHKGPPYIFNNNAQGIQIAYNYDRIGV